MEERKNNDEADYCNDALESCADLLWNREFLLDITIIRSYTLTFFPEYQVNQQETGLQETDSASLDVIDMVTKHLLFRPDCDGYQLGQY